MRNTMVFAITAVLTYTTYAQDQKAAPAFRSEPMKSLSREQFAMVVRQHDFYCASNRGSTDMSWCQNPSGRGVRNKFKKHAGQLVLKDEATGLYWQRDASQDGMYFIDTSRYISDLNINKFGGFSDWRLPRSEERRV